MISLENLKKHLNSNKSTQKIISEHKKFPLIHFSENTKDILKEGFIYGTNLDRIDYSFDDHDNGFSRIKEKEGYNYAFNTLNFDFYFNIMDYEYGLEGGDGMYESEALIFLSDCLYTNHIDGFRQCVFAGKDADLSNAIYLKEVLESKNEEIQELLDDGEIIWTAKTKDNDDIVTENEILNLNECIGSCLSYLIKENIISTAYISDFNDAYGDGDIIMSIPEKEKGITKLKLLRLVNNTINEINDDLNIDNDFNNSGQFYIEKINNKLKKENIKTKVKGKKIFVNNYIIDLTTDRNPNNFVYENNKLKNKKKPKIK